MVDYGRLRDRSPATAAKVTTCLRRSTFRVLNDLKKDDDRFPRPTNTHGLATSRWRRSVVNRAGDSPLIRRRTQALATDRTVKSPNLLSSPCLRDNRRERRRGVEWTRQQGSPI